METPSKIRIAALIEETKVGSFQWGIFVLCGLCLVMDGFDVQAMGYIAPALTHEWHVPNSALGPIFSAALFGVLVGSLLFSMLADKIGRRPVLVGGSLYFSVLTLLTARATSLDQLLFIRFIAGLGLGSIMPNAMALVGEYSPRKIRILVMMITSCGFTAGAALGGFIAAVLIPSFGWRSVFYLGGAVPLVLATLMWRWLPESLQFLALKKNPAELLKWARRLDPDWSLPVRLEDAVEDESKRGVPAFHLFREGRASATILLWIVNFMNLLNLYFLSSWIPTVVRDAGYSTSIAVLVGTTVQVGGTIGSFGNGWLIGRFGFVRALTSCFAIGAIAIAFIGDPALSLSLLTFLVFVAGWCVVGGQPGVNAVAAIYYPTHLRSTGIGWGLGVGRIGAIAGPIIGGQLLALHWTPRQVFLAAAVPAGVSAIVMLALRGAIRGVRNSEVIGSRELV